MTFQNCDVFLSLKINLSKQTVKTDEMPHYVAFHLSSLFAKVHYVAFHLSSLFAKVHYVAFHLSSLFAKYIMWHFICFHYLPSLCDISSVFTVCQSTCLLVSSIKMVNSSIFEINISLQINWFVCVTNVYLQIQFIADRHCPGKR